ncbi:unnamed protein product [Spirodela intermedia]|uniref:DDE Tnp4 domain-containing protein n=2 Tax=Spirodela intermedia TaxID=51605 RepID=A0A7I8LCE5_SPIIN|nr:unnamed protein product [Spirodela intermedia]CAA6669985.1 unnamed protein product [Spirodela intermedia]CAA7406968.1 unnamed protein product [Spirodela intermedia]
MENRAVAAAATAAVSQALVLLFSLPSYSSSSADDDPTALLFHFLSSFEIAAAGDLFLPRNRKRRRHLDDPGDPPPGAAVAAAPISVRRQPDHFRLGLGVGASTFEWLAGLLDPLLDWPGGPQELPAAAARLAVGLSHLATGASYGDLAARFAVSAAAARSCARRLRRVLCTNFRFWVAFPSPSSELSAGFRHLPGCRGAVACARFDLGGSGGAAAQVVADASCRILNIAAGFPKDQPSSTILRRSSLFQEAGRLMGPPEEYLVGGEEYPLMPWLMVPFLDASAASPAAFNAVHRRIMARTVLRTISSLMNWGVLSSAMEGEEDPRAVAACVATCAILHNMLLSREDFSSLTAAPPEEEDDDDDGDRSGSSGENPPGGAAPAAAALRDALADKVRGILTQRHPSSRG